MIVQGCRGGQGEEGEYITIIINLLRYAHT